MSKKKMDIKTCEEILNPRPFTKKERNAHKHQWPAVERGSLVTCAVDDLDPDGCEVKKGEQGVVFEDADYYEDGAGPMVRWFSGGCCNIYIGDIEEG